MTCKLLAPLRNLLFINLKHFRSQNNCNCFVGFFFDDVKTVKLWLLFMV